MWICTIHLKTAQLLSRYLLFFFKWQSTYIFRRWVTPSRNSLSVSPHKWAGRGVSSVLEQSANHNLPNLASFLEASAMVQSLMVLRTPALQTSRWRHPLERLLYNLTFEGIYWWPEARTLRQYHDISWYNMLCNYQYHCTSLSPSSWHKWTEATWRVWLCADRKEMVCLTSNVWGDIPLRPRRTGVHWGEKKGYFLAPVKLRYDLRKAYKKPYLGRGNKDLGC